MRRLYFLLLFLSIGVQAATLTLEDCIREAWAHNADLVAAREVIVAAEANAGSSRSNFWPQLSAQISASRANSPTSLSTLNSTGNGSSVRNQYSESLSADLNLFRGFSDLSQVSLARLRIQQSRAQFDATQAQLLSDLRGAFANMLYSQEAVRLNSAIADRRKTNYEVVELRFEVGRENKGAYLVSKAAYRQSEFDIHQAERDLRVARRNLARLMGQDRFDVFVVTGTLSNTLPTAPNDFLSLAQATPEYRQAAIQQAIDQENIRLQKSGFWPTVNASLTGTRSGSDWPPDSDRWNLGLSLSYPFFTGFSTYYGVKEANAQARQSAAELLSVQRETASSLDEQWAGFENAIERTDVQKETLAAYEVRAEIARNQYQNGLISFQDWDGIENNLISQRKQTLAAYRDSVVAEANWQRALGQGSLR